MHPNYQAEIADAVEAKLLELDKIPFGNGTGRRFTLDGVFTDGSPMTPEYHRENRRKVMVDIAERLGLHFFEMTDAVVIDQLITVSVHFNHDTSGLLRSLINSFMIAYINPETSPLAFQKLQELEWLRTSAERGSATASTSTAKH